VGLDLGVKDPFHVFQRQLEGERPLGRVNRGGLPGRPRSSSILGDFGIETLSNIEEGVHGKT
jgi:hypothetical protein